MAGRSAYLGEFEQVVLLAVVRLKDGAYGTNIRREIETRTGRRVTIGAMYVTLDRLAEKGYLRARDAPAGEIRGGRPRRFFTITASGVAALEAARTLQSRMWAGIQLRGNRS
ncbi:MAG TPA: helix-turn-helix transcriptional regulator [Vicinamibacterales bacterium]|nr:helix-turn-helix transcriptional regulator [Vicinamibacterales bacterium]